MHVTSYGSNRPGSLNVILPQARTYSNFSEFVQHAKSIAALPDFHPGERHFILFPETPFPAAVGDDPRAEIAALQQALREHPNFTVAYSKFNTKTQLRIFRKKQPATAVQREHPAINNIGYLVSAGGVRAGAKAYYSSNEERIHLEQGNPAADYNEYRHGERFKVRTKKAGEDRRVFPTMTQNSRQVSLVVCGDSKFITPYSKTVHLMPANKLKPKARKSIRMINDLTDGATVSLPHLAPVNLSGAAQHQRDRASTALARAGLRVHVVSE